MLTVDLVLCVCPSIRFWTKDLDPAAHILLNMKDVLDNGKNKWVTVKNNVDHNTVLLTGETIPLENATFCAK